MAENLGKVAASVTRAVPGADERVCSVLCHRARKRWRVKIEGSEMSETIRHGTPHVDSPDALRAICLSEFHTLKADAFVQALAHHHLHLVGDGVRTRDCLVGQIRERSAPGGGRKAHP